jgi:arabinose-5-phosphate isomerase
MTSPLQNQKIILVRRILARKKMMESPSKEADLETLRTAKEYIKLLADSIDNVEFDGNFLYTVDLFVKCKGKVITTGMGKAGIAMRKFSSTLCSLGIPSCYLHPGEASHGDLGIIQSQDIMFVASTSGKTREVLETLDAAKNLGVSKIIGITSHEDSPIREKSDFYLDMGDIIEAGKLGLAPTSSILVMIAITDVLALVASEKKGFTERDYGTYHHGGYLGAQARGDDTIY